MRIILKCKHCHEEFFSGKVANNAQDAQNVVASFAAVPFSTIPLTRSILFCNNCRLGALGEQFD